MQYLALFIRVFGIYMFIKLVSAIPQWRYFVDEVNSMRESGAPDYAMNAIIIVYVSSILASLFVIKFPSITARILVPGKNMEAYKVDFSVEQLETICFTVLGIYVLSFAVPDLVFNFLQLWGEESVVIDSSRISTTKINIIVTLVEISIGLLLTFKSSGLYKIIQKYRG